jgi:hypothetical protein
MADLPMDTIVEQVAEFATTGLLLNKTAHDLKKSGPA